MHTYFKKKSTIGENLEKSNWKLHKYLNVKKVKNKPNKKSYCL